MFRIVWLNFCFTAVMSVLPPPDHPFVKDGSNLDAAEIEFLITHVRYGEESSQHHAIHVVASLCAVMPQTRKKLGESNLIGTLISLLSSPKPRIKAITLNALANLAYEGRNDSGVFYF